MEPSTDRAKRDLRDLRALRSSRGWAIVEGVLRDDILSASAALSDNPNMPEPEMRFRMGAIRAARNYLTLLDTLMQRLDADLALSSAQANAGADLFDPIPAHDPNATA